MILDYTVYIPRKYGMKVHDIEKHLPPQILEECDKIPELPNWLKIKTEKEGVIREIDTLLNVSSNWDIKKSRYVEVDVRDIPKYDYFKISPRPIDWRDDYEYSTEPPLCKTEACFPPTKLTGPFQVKAKSVKDYDICVLHLIGAAGVYLYLSHRTKQLFESKAFTGVVFEPCTYLENGEDAGFIASLTDEFVPVAKSHELKGFCPQHKTWIAGKENRLELDLDSCRLLDTDFQFSCGYSYAGEKYYPSTPPQWFISTRVLLAILEQKSKGLEIISYIRPRKFIPYCEPIS